MDTHQFQRDSLLKMILFYTDILPHSKPCRTIRVQYYKKTVAKHCRYGLCTHDSRYPGKLPEGTVHPGKVKEGMTNWDKER